MSGTSRRQLLRRASAALAGAGLAHPRLESILRARQAPAIISAPGDRPALPFGVAAGDVSDDRATIWSRVDRPARMAVEWDTSPAFTAPRRLVGPAALEDTDYTARVELGGLPPGQRVSYRVSFQDLRDLRRWSEPVGGSFVTPAGQDLPRDVTIAFSADTCGQGWGINPEFGGFRLYETMGNARPDLFVHLGDTVYTDQPLVAEVKLDEGRVWKNIVTPEKSKVAETQDEFRGNYRYNLLDQHMRRFNAEVGQFVIWDDHEVLDNWYAEKRLDEDPRYREKSVALLAARARKAFLEYNPIRVDPIDAERIYRACRFGPLVEVFGFDMRSYRSRNSPGRERALGEDARILGAEQVRWMKQRLAASTAVWKVIASDMPIGVVVPDFPLTRGTYEAVANGEDGPPLGRELEIADLLTFIRDRRIRNVVFITADVHYCAAHHYDPARGSFGEFAPFWEFVGGPLHAGTFGPNALDRTFGPEVRFLGIPPGMKPNRPPSDGFQFYGLLKVDAATKALTSSLHDMKGTTLWSLELPAET